MQFLCSVRLNPNLTWPLATDNKSNIYIIFFLNREKIVISSLSKQIVIVIFSELCSPTELPSPSEDSSLSGLRGDEGDRRTGRRGEGRGDGSRADTIAAGDQCPPGGKVAGV